MNRLFNPRPRTEYIEATSIYNDLNEKIYKASYVVSYICKKYGVNPVWVWDELGEQFNIIKGTNGSVLASEKTALEKYIEQQINDDNS